MASPQKKQQEKTAAPKRLIVQRKPTRAPQTRIEWDVTVDKDTTLEDLLQPSYWTNVAGNTFSGPNNFVTVYWEDRTKLAFLYVRQYEPTFAKMEVISYHEFDKAKKLEAPEQFAVTFIGPIEKFRITRKEDGQTIREGFASKEDALKFIDEQNQLLK
jgi:hypothetical protein